MKKRYDVLLFDLDGTLTDSAPGIFNSFRYALERMGAKEPTIDDLRPCVGPPLTESFSRFGFEGEVNTEAIRQYRVYYEKTGIFENTVYPGVVTMLAELKDAGFTLVVASSKKEESVRRVVDHFDLTRYFDFIAGSDDITRFDKGDVIAHVIKTLSPDRSRALMIGDRYHDIEGARLHGLPSMGVLWGYGSFTELTSHGADLIAEKPGDVIKLVSE